MQAVQATQNMNPKVLLPCTHARTFAPGIGAKVAQQQIAAAGRMAAPAAGADVRMLLQSGRSKTLDRQLVSFFLAEGAANMLRAIFRWLAYVGAVLQLRIPVDVLVVLQAGTANERIGATGKFRYEWVRNQLAPPPIMTHRALRLLLARHLPRVNREC